MKETAADAVKLEGGSEVIESVLRIISAGIPVMGHLGLTPQSIHKFGTYSVRAKKVDEADKLLKDAHLLQKAGCFSIVLEKFRYACHSCRRTDIPVIGIGAGRFVDGQVSYFLYMPGYIGISRFFRRYPSLCGDSRARF